MRIPPPASRDRKDDLLLRPGLPGATGTMAPDESAQMRMRPRWISLPPIRPMQNSARRKVLLKTDGLASQT